MYARSYSTGYAAVPWLAEEAAEVLAALTLEAEEDADTDAEVGKDHNT